MPLKLCEVHYVDFDSGTTYVDHAVAQISGSAMGTLISPALHRKKNLEEEEFKKASRVYMYICIYLYIHVQCRLTYSDSHTSCHK